MRRWSWFRIAETSAIAWIAACEQLEAAVQLACSRAQIQDRSVWKLSDGNVCDSGRGLDCSVLAVCREAVVQDTRHCFSLQSLQ